MSESMRKLINLVESMDDQMPRRDPTDPTVPMNMTDFVRNAKEMPSFDMDGSPKRPLNVIRDKELIIKAYELYLKGFEVGDPKTPAQAILQAHSTMQNMAFESDSVTEAPMNVDPIQLVMQRLDQLEQVLDAYDPEKFKKIMAENLKAIQKLEAYVMLLEKQIEASEDSAKRAFDHAQQQHLRLSSLKDYMNKGGDLSKVESVDVEGKPTFKDKYLGGAGDNLPAVNLDSGKKFQAKRARVIGKDWPIE